MSTTALGDNFYFTGISLDRYVPSSNNRSDAFSARFQDTFEDVFTATSLQSEAQGGPLGGFRFYVVGGNHDHYGNITAQLAYTEISPRWHYPELWYSWSKPVDEETTVQFVYIDTVGLSGNSDVHDPETHELLQELDGSELPQALNHCR